MLVCSLLAAFVLAPGQAADPPWVTRSHEMPLGDETMRYTTTSGFMPIKNDSTGEVEGRMFFMAYTRTGGAERRPLTFSFNGGPGSSSVWLHLGALGPKRVKMRDDGMMPPPPYEAVANPETWLTDTDLVFIDPIGTGYSRPTKSEFGAKFWSVQGDIDSVAEFIRLYLTQHKRWLSPLFLVGESYGTLRAAGLSSALLRQGIALNGVMLVSTILNYQTVDAGRGNDLPFQLYLPTYAATAHYHRKMPPDLQRRKLADVLKEVEEFAAGEYAKALAKGDLLPEAARAGIASKLARYTGLSEKYILQTNLRVRDGNFYKELLRDEGWTVGRLDSRFKGMDASGVGASPEYDPSMAAITPPYTAVLNDYVRRELGFESEVPYYILGGGLRSPWSFGSGNSYADTSESLRRAMVQNPFMKVFVGAGYYDLATPYFAAEYTISHMGLDRRLRSNVSVSYYEAGHMMYIDVASLAKLKRDVRAFIASSIAK